MHGLPVRVVAVMNVDVWFMSRRTPSDSVLGREVPDGSGSEDASGTTGVGLRELRPPPERKFGEGIDLVVAVTGFFDRLLTRTK